VHVLVFPQFPCKLLNEELAESPSTIVATPNAAVIPTPTHGAHFFQEEVGWGSSTVWGWEIRSGLVETEGEGTCCLGI
jgi:hypothetical protein